jgi:hypothetical protein
MVSRTRIGIRVDDDGMHFPSGTPGSGPLDLLIGGHRVWSFVLEDDGTIVPARVRTIRWPLALRSRLQGRAAVVIRRNDGLVLFAQEVVFGGSTNPLALTDEHGIALCLDKAGRMQRTFEHLDPDSIEELVGAASRVLDDLVACGARAYLCYGALLGARRTGHLIGHDSDLDLAFLSHGTHPFDVIRETRRLEESMRRRGWTVLRMSSANFKVWIPLPGGGRAGVDVFGSCTIGDHFHLTGSLRGRLGVDSMLPLGSIELEGVAFPAPRDVEAFLAYTYGPGWSIPEPSFHFSHPKDNIRIMSAWWRGQRPDLTRWQNHWKFAPPVQPHLDTVAWVSQRVRAGARILELGSGDGADALALAERGYDVTASDYVPAAHRRATARFGRRRPRWQTINVAATHAVLARGAELGSSPEPVTVLARDLVDELHPFVRPTLWRFCSLVGRSGGHTLVEFRTTGRTAMGHPKIDPNLLEQEIVQAGGAVVDRRRDLGKAGTALRWEVTWR